MEMLDLYDVGGKRLGRTVERGEWKETEDSYVKIIHVFVMNGKGDILIQQRAFNKKAWPGRWSILGGFVVSGEEPEDAVLRETAEEYGVDVSRFPRRLLLRVIREGHGAIMEFWMIAADIRIEDVVRQVEEVEDVKYVAPGELLTLYSEEDRWNGFDAQYRDAVLALVARIPELFGALTAGCEKKKRSGRADHALRKTKKDKKIPGC